MSDEFVKIPDTRQAGKVQHDIHDVLMSAFAMMFFQDPSLLQFQTRMKEDGDRCNLETLFRVKSIPGDTQIREIIDDVDPQKFRSIFKSYVMRLQRGKHLEQYQLFPGLHLVVGDGSGYFGSDKVHCPGCLTNKSSGKQRFLHKIMQAAIVHPDKKQVIPFMPEEIRNREDNKKRGKQDCEQAASARLIRQIRADHPRLGIIFSGDGLYSNEVVIEDLQMARMSYILVCKPGNHEFLFSNLEKQRKKGKLQKMEYVDEKGKRRVYEWINQVPLFKFELSENVNYFSFRIVDTDENGRERTTYQNNWITDLEITEKNVETFVRAGRARWKIENECFNNLKNQGYNIEHNYGHGKNHLSFNFLILTLLAFFYHQIFELTDHLYQACRIKRGSKRHLWEKLRSYIGLLVFRDWEQLMRFTFDPSEFNLRIDSS